VRREDHRLKADNYAGVGASVSSYTVSQWLAYWLTAVKTADVRGMLNRSVRLSPDLPAP
jgi:hypothetical protein